MWSLIGLTLNSIGAFLVLIPDIPWLFKQLSRIPPLKTVEEAEKKLYMEGEITPSDSGFDRIEEAILSGSKPFSDVDRLDNLENMDSYLRINDQEVEFEGSGWRLQRIEKEDENVLSNSDFSVEMYSESGLNMGEWLLERGLPPLTGPYLESTIPNGTLPEMIDEYKKRIISRTGAILLLIGFIAQIIGKMS